jgi:hypothetical protein
MKTVFFKIVGHFYILFFVLTIARIGGAIDKEDIVPQLSDEEEESTPLEENDNSSQESGMGGECFPQCRSAFLCHKSVCISRCNPPCPEQQRCTVEGECTGDGPVLTTLPTEEPVTQHPDMHVSPRGEDTETYRGSEKDTPRFNKTGLTFTFGMGPSLGFYFDEDVDNPSEMVGLTLMGELGARILPRLSVECTISYTPTVIYPDENGETDSQYGIEIGAGVSTHVFGGNYRADLVLGLHFGYAHSKYIYDGEFRFENSLHGLYLSYSAGLLIHVARPLSLVVGASFIEPFWITRKWGFDDNIEEESFDGDHKSLDFRPGVSLVGVF